MTEFLDPRSAGIQALFLGLFDVTHSSAVAACSGVPGVWWNEVDSEVNTEVNTEVNAVIIRCKLSKTGTNSGIFSKTGTKFSKTWVYPMREPQCY